MKKISLMNIIFFLIFFSVIFSLKAEASTLNRIQGINRYETAVAISKEGWTTSNYVILVTEEDFPDALCAAPLASLYNAPILLTNKDNINQETIEELKRLKVKNIFIVGGTGVVSAVVLEKVSNLSYDGQVNPIVCERIYGNNRTETSIEVAKRLPSFKEVVIATGADFPDALSGSALASKYSSGILLMAKSPDVATRNFIYTNQKNIETLNILGGSGVVSDTAVRELSVLYNRRRISF